MELSYLVIFEEGLLKISLLLISFYEPTGVR